MSATGLTAGAPPASWRVAGTRLDVARPVVLGILNLTPDSFCDGGRHGDTEAALAHAEEMVAAGADLVDVGGESTRPGARPVVAAEEWRRIGEVVRQLAVRGVAVSVDTTKAWVARRAVDAGALALNDVSGLTLDPELADVAASSGAGLILMHRRGTPETMQHDVSYADLMAEVTCGLAGSVAEAERRGCDPEQLVVDPGIGFGKSARGSLRLIARLAELRALGRPILVGPSRKSFIGETLGLAADQRLEATLAACVAALERGARLFRVHDVGPARRALDMAWAIRQVDAEAEDR